MLKLLIQILTWFSFLVGMTLTSCAHTEAIPQLKFPACVLLETCPAQAGTFEALSKWEGK